jgi:hypothetical protein
MVLWMTGNPQYTNYEPYGEQPVHIQIWFRESARPAVQKLIADLQALAETAPNKSLNRGGRSGRNQMER